MPAPPVVNASRVQKAAFLKVIAEKGNLTVAAEVVGVDRTNHYYWLRSDPEYRAAFEDAKASATERLEAEAWRRAAEGVEKPTGWHKGEAGGTVREYSDVLLIFLLKAHNPQKYRDQQPLGAQGPLEIVVRDETTDGRARQLASAAVPYALEGPVQDAEVVDVE